MLIEKNRLYNSWFGPFPFWMPYTLASIRKNKDIDFIFFTDNEAPKNALKNCKFNLISFENYKNLVSQNLGINFTPEKPYKLCDIKPAYGLIHKEEISNYDFWGFCDIDVVFGDLRYFLNNELLTKYEFFSSFGTRVAGHFTIMKTMSIGIACLKTVLIGNMLLKIIRCTIVLMKRVFPHYSLA